jgi:predicted nucleic acid-binding protein
VSVVVDASVIVALVVADEHQDAAQTCLEGWLAAGEGLHAPTVLPYEVANVLARLVFDGVLDVDEVTEIWQDLAALGLVLHPFDLAQDGCEVAAITARLRRRHATDSSYICLAQHLETEVWTLDGALARNAADLGLPVKLVS